MPSVGAELDWRRELPALVHQAAQQIPHPSSPAWFRLADASLEIVTDYEPLLRELDAVYGDCGSRISADGSVRIRCTATLLRGTTVLSLTFDGPQTRDPAEIALVPYRFRRHRPYVETPSPLAGWRLFVSAGAEHRPLIASNARDVLINLEQAPAEFLLDCIVGVAQSAQPGVLFFHAASVGVAGAGALLIAPSFGGKSSTALSLAHRGHAFLGDDVAAVRLKTRELLPFPKSAGLRDGPLARVLRNGLPACRHFSIPGRHGIPRMIVRARDLFPGSGSGPIPLRFAFVLDGFAEAATIAPLKPSFDELKRLRKTVVMETMASWGLSPGRDLLQFLTIVDLLSGLSCYSVKLGPIDETATMIEDTMQAGLAIANDDRG